MGTKWNIKKKYCETIPMKIETDFLNYNKKMFDEENFTFYEMVDGISFVLVKDEKKLTIHSSKKVSEIVSFFNNKLLHKTRSLLNHFSNENLAIYGIFNEEAKDPIMFLDLYINENWIRNDDFLELFSNFNLPTIPVIYTGNFNDKILKQMREKIGKKSLAIETGIINNIYAKSLNMLGVHDKLKKGVFLINKKKQIDYEIITKDFLGKNIDKKTIDNWEIKLKARRIDKTKENRKIIFPLLVKDFIKSNDLLIQNISVCEGVLKEDVIKKIKKLLPSVIETKILKG